jgi:hypothetical protein
VSHKLALYFLGQDGSQSRVLEADRQPIHPPIEGWRVGRSPSAEIVFSPSRNPAYRLVSKFHAVITATLATDATEGGTPIYRWSIADWGVNGLGSSNGTFLGRDNHRPYRLQPGAQYSLKEGDRIQFGCRAAEVKVSFDIDDTESDNYEEIEDDGPPTGVPTNIPIRKAKADHSPWFVPDILEPVWVWYLGKSTPTQFVFLLAIGGVSALILYVWKL